MRSRVLLAVMLIVLPAVALAASTLPASFASWPLAVLEPGSLFFLGCTFLLLASVAQRALMSDRRRGPGSSTTS